MKYISTLREGERINEIFLCKSKQTAMTKSGKPYDNVILQDKTGTLDAKIWDVGSVGIEEFDAMDYIAITGDITSFQGNLQCSIKRARKVNEGEYDPADYLPVSDKDVEVMYKELMGFIGSVKNQYLSQLLHSFFDNKEFERRFKFHSAAKSVHHGFLSGLLMHTLNMLRLADFLSAQYADTVNRSLLLTGTLLHDFAKEQEFTFSELGLVTDYSTKGQLLGHLVMGAQEVAAIAAELDLPEEKATLLEHLILSHHGQPEFGAAVLPQCAEAELLSLVDQIDSRMEIYREVLAPLKAGEFSQRVFALDNRRVYKHQ